MTNRFLSAILCIAFLFSICSVGVLAQNISGIVKINEICSGNNGANGNLSDIKDTDGKLCDWIELYNPMNVSVDLSGWGLSDSISNPFKDVFKENTIIKAGEFLLIYCSKSLDKSEKYNSISINLSGDGEDLLLTSKDSSYCDKVSFPALAKDTVYARVPDGSDNFSVTYPTPLKTNNSAEKPSLISAPIFSKNGGMYSSPFDLTISSSADGIIYYTTDGSDPKTSTTKLIYKAAIKIKDLTGNRNDLSNKVSDKYVGKANVIRAVVQSSDGQFSQVTSASYFLGANNETYGNMPIMSLVTDSKNLFSEETGICVEGKTRTDFRSSHIFKSGSQLKFVLKNINAGNYKLSITSYNGSDKSSFKTFVNNVQVGDVISTSTGSGNTENSVGDIVQNQNGDLVITTEACNVKSGSFCIVNFILQNSVEEKTTIASQDCSPLGRQSTADEFTEDMAIKRTLSSVKVVNLFESGNVSWNSPANYNQKGREWERECSVEYFEDDGELKLSQNGGIRIQGSYSRLANQKSFRLFARADYGKKNFNYSFFDDAYDINGNKIEKFKTLVLRNGGNDSGDTKFTDAYYQDLMKDRKAIETQSSRPVMVYIDGEFWGMYHLYQDYTADYLQSKYNINSDNCVIYKNGRIEEGYDNDSALFDEMYNFIMNNDMSIQANYQKAAEYMDLDSYVNYLAVEFSLSNGDWPGNNYSLWRSRTVNTENKYEDGKWRFMLFDTDHCGSAWGDERFNSGRWQSLYNNIAEKTKLTNMAVKLKANPDFAKKMSLTMLDILNVNLDCYRAVEKLNEYNDYYINEGRLFYHWKRFGGGLSIYQNRYNCIVEFINGRKGYVPGGTNAGKINLLTLTSNYANAGLLKINSSTVDLMNMEYNEFTGKYGDKYPLTITATAKDGYEFIGWTGDVNSSDASISVTMSSAKNIKAVYQKIDGVYINEICTYNIGGNNNLAEVKNTAGAYCDWIELYNSFDYDVDLSGWGVTNDSSVPFKATLKDGMIIKAKSFLVLYCSKDLPLDTTCWYVPFNLSKSGETISITSKDLLIKDTIDCPALQSDTTYCRKTDGDNILKVKYPSPNCSNNNNSCIPVEKLVKVKPVYSDYENGNYKFTTIEDFENCTPEYADSTNKVVSCGKVLQFLSSGNVANLNHNIIQSDYVNKNTDSKKSLKFTGSAGWENYEFGVPLNQEQIKKYVGIRVWVKADMAYIRKTQLSLKLQKSSYTTVARTDSDISTMDTSEGHWEYIVWGEPDNHIWANRVRPEDVSSEILQVNFDFLPTYKSVVYLDDFQFIEKNVLNGDVNSDNTVDINDLLCLRKYLAGYKVDINKSNSDLDKNGVIKINDAYILRKYLAGYITSI